MRVRAVTRCLLAVVILCTVFGAPAWSAGRADPRGKSPRELFPGARSGPAADLR